MTQLQTECGWAVQAEPALKCFMLLGHAGGHVVMHADDHDCLRWTFCYACDVLFPMLGDNWFRLERMHDDRVGLGPMAFDSLACLTAWLSAQEVM